jgi:hypothetical protein
MSEENGQQPVGRPVELTGDSPELIAFALLRYLAQLEQDSGQAFDRAWMLDAYSECLEAVAGKRKPSAQLRPAAPARPAAAAPKAKPTAGPVAARN